MKWVFGVTLVLAIALSVIASITKPKEENKGEVATLVWATDGNPARQEQMELFRRWHLKRYGQKIGIKLDQSNAGRDKVIIQSISGAGPDVFDFHEGGSDLERYVKSGVMLDLTDVAKEKGFPPDLVWEGYRTAIVYEGRQYGFPDNASNSLFLYHRDLFDQMGVPYPKPGWTWHDFLKIAQKFAYREKNGMRHFAVSAFDINGITAMMYSNGATMFTEDGTKCVINSREGLEALRFYYDMQHKYRIVPTKSELLDQATAGGWGSGDINMFGTTGKKYFAMAYGARWWAVIYSTTVKQANPNDPPLFNIGVIQAPTFKSQYVIGGCRCTGINRNSKNVKYAKRFIEFLASEEYNRQINRSFDAIAPARKYCEKPYEISDNKPAPKGLDFVNDPLWVSTMKYVHEYPTSPFIPPYRVKKIWEEEQGKMDSNDRITPETMLNTFARRVNEEMQRNIQADPKLTELYNECKEKNGQRKQGGGKL